MLSKTRSTPARAVFQDAVATTPSNGASVATGSGIAPTPPSTDGASVATSPGVVPSTATERETRREHSRRKAHRSRLHAYAIVAVALVVFLIRLAVSNTAQVKVNWVFGTSQVSLVWVVLLAAILGWLLGLVATAAFHWRTRAPRHDHGGQL